jgi:hypothetical protein
LVAATAVAAAALVSFPALAQSAAGNVINDGAYPSGFDCGSLGTPAAKLECQTFESNRTPNDTIPPGTPAIPMPGDPNTTGQDFNQHGAPPNINIRGKGNNNR